MTSSSKSKGNRGEREVADHLTKYFKLNFERVPNSGAFTGGKNSFRKARLTRSQKLLTEGDLIVPEELYGMKVECKSYKKFSWHLLYTGNKQLDDWIAQAEDTEKIWFLTFKISYCGTYVVFSHTHFDDFAIPNNFHVYKEQYIICEFHNFFKNNSKKLLHMCKNQL